MKFTFEVPSPGDDLGNGLKLSRSAEYHLPEVGSEITIISDRDLPLATARVVRVEGRSITVKVQTEKLFGELFQLYAAGMVSRSPVLTSEGEEVANSYQLMAARLGPKDRTVK